MNDATAPHHEKSRQAGSIAGILAAFVVLAIVILVLLGKVHSLNTRLEHAPEAQKLPAEAKSDAAQVQAELEKAKSASAQLQAQLDQAKTQQSALQAQIDEYKSASEQHQAKLDEAKAQSADLQSQLEKAKTQSADLQAQLGQATSRSSQLAAELERAKAQSVDLQAQLEKARSEIARVQPMVERARHLPITTNLEKIHGGPFEFVSAIRSITLHVTNLYLEPLSVNITVTSQGKAHSQSNTIHGGGTLNVEKLAAGDKVVIESEGYNPVSLTVE